MEDKITFERVDLGDGIVYEGEILNGSQFVFGKYSTPNGITYIGEFNKDSEMEGMGRFILDAEEIKSESIGMFKGIAPNGFPMLNGIGTVRAEIGGNSLYKAGMFVNDQLHGQGVSHTGQSKYEGGFSNDQYHGKGRITNPNGTSFEVEYDHGKAINAGTSSPPVQAEYSVILKTFDDAKKIAVIKEVRAVTGLGLKEARDLVEGAPQLLRENISMEWAVKIRDSITAAGGTVEMV